MQVQGCRALDLSQWLRGEKSSCDDSAEEQKMSGVKYVIINGNHRVFLEDNKGKTMTSTLFCGSHTNSPHFDHVKKNYHFFPMAYLKRRAPFLHFGQRGGHPFFM